MNRKILFVAIGCIAILVFAFRGRIFRSGPDPWTEKQLMQPAALAHILNEPNSKKPVILSIGFGGGIKGSKELGAADDKEGIENLKKELSGLSKDADIVIYCGCCPFEDCPNVRPAFELLNQMKFTNHKLLNLSQNLKVDWIDNGYPMERQ